MRLLYILCALTVAFCSTPDVTAACNGLGAVLNNPLLALAPADVQLAASALKVGSAVCGSPEYAAARDKVLTWIKSKS